MCGRSVCKFAIANLWIVVNIVVSVIVIGFLKDNEREEGEMTVYNDHLWSSYP